MEKKDRNNLIVSIVAVIGTLLGALGGSYLTASYTLKSAQEQIKKDITLLSAKNSFTNSQEIKKRSESYLVSFYQLIELIDNDRFYVDEAEKIISKMNFEAQGLMVYGGPELGSASLNLNSALRDALISSSQEELRKDLENVLEAAGLWYPTFHSVIQSYDKHTMLEKYKAEFKEKLLESIAKGLNKKMQPAPGSAD